MAFSRSAWLFWWTKKCGIIPQQRQMGGGGSYWWCCCLKFGVSGLVQTTYFGLISSHPLLPKTIFSFWESVSNTGSEKSDEWKCLRGNIPTVKLESEAEMILDSSTGAQRPDRVHTAGISPSYVDHRWGASRELLSRNADPDLQQPCFLISWAFKVKFEKNLGKFFVMSPLMKIYSAMTTRQTIVL